MKIYQVNNDGDYILSTPDELKALRRFRLVMEKHKVNCGWIDETEVE